MKSRITIEVDFDNGKPYIKVAEDFSTDDVRDKLISFFRQQLGSTSSWCRVEFHPYHDKAEQNRWIIKPITPDELKDQAVIMSEQARLITDVPKQDKISH